VYCSVLWSVVLFNHDKINVIVVVVVVVVVIVIVVVVVVYAGLVGHRGI